MFRAYAILLAVGTTFDWMPRIWAQSEPVLPSAFEQIDFTNHVRTFLGKYCVDCHGEEKKADVNFEVFKSQPRFYTDRTFWEKVVQAIESREMPPDKKPQPHEADRVSLVRYLNAELAKFDCTTPPTPGRVTLRRLNRVEYNNTIRDLIGIDFKPAENFPLDEVGYGFDNIGDVLSLPPMLMEKYLEAAEQIASKAIVTGDPATLLVTRVKSSEFRPSNDNVGENGEGVFAFGREGEAILNHTFAQSGRYTLRIRASGDQAGPDPARMAVKWMGRELVLLDVTVPQDQPRFYEVPLTVEKGTHELRFGYINNYVVTDHPDPKLRGDRNLYLQGLEVVGPLGTPAVALPESHTRLIQRSPKAGEERKLAAETLEKLASRAFRRPATASEVERLVRFVDIAKAENGGFEEGIQLALQAVLTSPHFLFRWELDPEKRPPGVARMLSEYELASRLSYFIWCSMPDDTLFALAREGRLSAPEVLEGEIRRMLQDPRSRALAENFGGQWLQIRNFEAAPDPDTYPGFNTELRRAMVRETELFFDAIMREDRSIREFISADFTFLNERLARHYGVSGVQGEAFQRVRLEPSTRRGGVLTHASILTLTSNPTRTSPVNRGKWIMEQILGSPPPPPPPNVPELESNPQATATASLRTRLEQHRAKAECATCHNKMDPLGFALENFDGIGAWREKDGVFPIDPSGVLPDGRSLNGPQELITILAADESFVRAFTRKMFTFALGRGLEYYDKCAVDNAVAALKSNGHRFSVLVAEIIKSEPFRKRETAHQTP